ncbi:MAG: hypothetical protein DMG54_22795 [Acidobacteria bacterium]|nr:MAG: hypothetical protein DMG54_22795 [Acidobacteriota bacterium]
MTGDEVQIGNCSHTRRLFSHECKQRSSGIRNLKSAEEPDKKGDIRSGRPSNGALPYPYGPNAHAAGSSEPSEDSPPGFLPLHPALLFLPLAEAVTGDEVMNQPQAWQTYDRWLQDDRVAWLDDPSGIERILNGRRPATKDRADC